MLHRLLLRPGRRGAGGLDGGRWVPGAAGLHPRRRPGTQRGAGTGFTETVSTSMGNWKNSPHHRLTGEFTGENISPVKYW